GGATDTIDGIDPRGGGIDGRRRSRGAFSEGGGGRGGTTTSGTSANDGTRGGKSDEGAADAPPIQSAGSTRLISSISARRSAIASRIGPCPYDASADCGASPVV